MDRKKLGIVSITVFLIGCGSGGAEDFQTGTNYFDIDLDAKKIAPESDDDLSGIWIANYNVNFTTQFTSTDLTGGGTTEGEYISNDFSLLNIYYITQAGDTVTWQTCAEDLEFTEDGTTLTLSDDQKADDLLPSFLIAGADQARNLEFTVVDQSEINITFDLYDTDAEGELSAQTIRIVKAASADATIAPSVNYDGLINGQMISGINEGLYCYNSDYVKGVGKDSQKVYDEITELSLKTEKDLFMEISFNVFPQYSFVDNNPSSPDYSVKSATSGANEIDLSKFELTNTGATVYLVDSDTDKNVDLTMTADFNF